VKALALVAVVLVASPALAETPLPPKKKQPDPPPPPSPPDPIVSDAQNANLESTARHRGFSLTLAAGGAFTVGLGIDNSVGRGGGGSLRFGHVAGARYGFTAELATLQLLHRVEGTDDSGDLLRDQAANLLVGIQFYLKGALWLRLAGGFGGYDTADPPGGKPTKPLVGPSGILGAGFDIVRTRRLSIGLEYMSLGMINRDGLLSGNAFMLDVSLETN
jgi:hypothetical protein